MKRKEAIKKLAEWYKAGNIGGHVFAVPHVDSMSFYIEKYKNHYELELEKLKVGR